MDIFARLQNRFPKAEIERDFSFARHTTIGCGGTASVAISPPDGESVAELVTYLERERIPYCFLGAGANVLPCDGCYEGVVVRFHRLNEIKEQNGIYVGAGVLGGTLLAFCRAHGKSGLEPLAGIPTSVGGAVTMNAGIPGCYVSSLLRRVYAVDEGKIRVFSPAECCFSVKKSVFQNKIAVVGAEFSLSQDSPVRIRERVRFYLEQRKKLPKGKSMGCTFLNPKGIAAGALIERCGLKNMRVDKAHVSERHANFIINEGTSAQDIKTLIGIVRREVFEKTGILLQEEIRYLP